MSDDITPLMRRQAYDVARRALMLVGDDAERPSWLPEALWVHAVCMDRCWRRIVSSDAPAGREEVYSLWQNVATFSDRMDYWYGGLLVNGELYWTTSRENAVPIPHDLVFPIRAWREAQIAFLWPQHVGTSVWTYEDGKKQWLKRMR